MMDSIIDEDMEGSVEIQRNGGIKPDSKLFDSLSFPIKKESSPAQKKRKPRKVSSSSDSDRHKHDNSALSHMMPRDCQVDLDKDQIIKIGKDIHLAVIRTLENTRVKKTKASVLSTKIAGKIEELQYKVRTMDGGHCNYKTEDHKV